MSSDPPGCCMWCTGFISSCGLTALFMWLSVRPSKPHFDINKFEIPALNISVNSNYTQNTSISFQLKISNPNKESRVYYDDLNITLFYSHNLSLPVGNFTLPSFRQGHQKKAKKFGTVMAVGVPWEEARREVNETKKTVFRVDVATEVRYKIVFWMTQHRTIKVGGNVTVDDQGVLLKKKAKLSGAPVKSSSCMLTGFLVSLILFLFWF